MPQLRFNKDKRGYENTFVVHPTRRRGKGRTRILYWFRTPPGVRVGRGPLDEEAIRMLEAGNPDLEFDWTRILKGQPEPEGESRRDGAERQDRRDSNRRDRREAGRGRDRRAAIAPAAGDVTHAATPVEPADAAAPLSEPSPEPTTAAHARLGSEGLARLRARHSEMLARIEDRIPDAGLRDQLKTLAERLNPDAWVTDADVSAGLESYEATFAELRNALPGRRPAGRPTEDHPAADTLRSEETADGDVQ